MKLHCTLKSFAVAATMSIALAAAPSHALNINFFNGSDLYATMTTTGGTNFDLYFQGTGAAGAYVDFLLLNGPTGSFNNLSDPTVTTATGAYAPNGFNGGDGLGNFYDWKISFPNANNSPSRLTAGEHALWTITGTNANDWNFERIHINAFDGEGSIKLTGCVDGATGCTAQVPEPSSLLLLGAGLAGLGIWRKKIA